MTILLLGLVATSSHWAEADVRILVQPPVALLPHLGHLADPLRAPLIDYYKLEPETWIIIGSAGSRLRRLPVVPAAGLPGRRGTDDVAVPRSEWTDSQKRFGTSSSLLSGIALGAVVQHWTILLEKFGSILNVIVLGNSSIRSDCPRDFRGGPLLRFVGLAGSFFAGIYTIFDEPFFRCSSPALPRRYRRSDRPDGQGQSTNRSHTVPRRLFPPLPDGGGPGRRPPPSFVRKFATVGFAILLFAVAGEVVRSNRGIEESIPGANRP